MTSQEPFTQHLPDPDFPDTEVILVEQPAPVFVDSTGRRRRVLRRFSYVFGAFCMVYGGLISLSLAGGPVSPNAVLPFPDLITGAGRTVEAAPTPTARTTVTAPKAVLVNDAVARRAGRQPSPRVTATGRTPARPARTGTPSTMRPKPPATAKTRAQWQATVVSPRPVEATTTRRPAPSMTPATTMAPITVPPAPPMASTPSTPQPTAAGNTGGNGGGGTAGGGTGPGDPGVGERR